MKKSKRRKFGKYKQTEDYYPLINPHSIEGTANIAVPSEEDIEKAKRWVDDVEK